MTRPWQVTSTGMDKALTWLKFSTPVLKALVARDLNQASALMGVKLGPFFVADEAVRRWRNRLEQARREVRTFDWIARVVVADTQVVGHAGFHGPPDEAGIVEVAYAVVPGHRNRGYAKAMLRGLLQRATLEPEVRVVRATIRPDNAASLATIRSFHFVHLGEQWDEIDGLELVFETDVSTQGNQHTDHATGQPNC